MENELNRCTAGKGSVGNPFMEPWERIPDGEPRIFTDSATGEKRMYVYGSHDTCKDFCCGPDHVVWSAPVDDLSDWRYEGVIYRKEQDPRNKNGKMHMCAPDCVQGPDGRYYLYYVLKMYYQFVLKQQFQLNQHLIFEHQQLNNLQ